MTCFFNLQTAHQCWQKNCRLYTDRTKDHLHWFLPVIFLFSPQRRSSGDVALLAGGLYTRCLLHLFVQVFHLHRNIGWGAPTVPKIDASLYISKREEKFDISPLLRSWRWKAAVTVSSELWFQRKLMSTSQSKIRGYFHHRERWRATSISFLSFSFFKNEELFYFFPLVVVTVNLWDQKFEQNPLYLLGNLDGNHSFSLLVLLAVVRWHPPWWQWCGTPLLHVTSDCKATSSKPKHQQLP